MQFIYPSFLYALGLIAIPIVIHLFNLVRPKKVIFSNVKFLKQVDLKSSRKVKLKHWLVLLSRILFVVSLVLLFAQPFISNGNLISEASNPIVSIYLDNSESMSAIEDNETNLNRSLKEIDKILDKYPRNTKFQLIDNDFNAKSLFLHSKDKIKDYLTEIEYSTSSRTATEVYSRQMNLLNKQASEFKQVIWFSDFQKSIFSDLTTIEKDTSIQYLLFKMSSNDTKNASVDSVYLLSPFITPNVDNELKIKITNSSVKDISNMPVSLIINEKLNSQTKIDVKANSTQEIEMNFNIDEIGEANCKIVIDDNSLAFDNTHFFNLTINNKIKVLTIIDTSASRMERVLKNEPLFELKVNNVKDINYGEIPSYDLIIFEELEQIPASLTTSIKELESTGVFVIPNRKIDIIGYQSALSGLGVEISSVLAAKQKIIAPKNSQPYFRGVFTKNDSKIDMPFVTPVFKVNDFSKRLLKSNTSSNILTLSGSKDNVVISSSSFSAPVSNMYRHSFVIPLMYRIAMMSSNVNRNLSYKIDEVLKRTKVEVTSNSNTFNLEQNNLVLTPEQYIIGNILNFKVDPLEVKRGFYKLKTIDFDKTIAFNSNQLEGDLGALSNEEILTISDVNTQDTNDSVQFINELNNGVFLWKYCLYLALLFLLVEILLIRLFRA